MRGEQLGEEGAGMEEGVEREGDGKELEDLLTSIEHEGNQEEVVGDGSHIHQLDTWGRERSRHVE